MVTSPLGLMGCMFPPLGDMKGRNMEKQKRILDGEAMYAVSFLADIILAHLVRFSRPPSRVVLCSLLKKSEPPFFSLPLFLPSSLPHIGIPPPRIRRTRYPTQAPDRLGSLSRELSALRNYTKLTSTAPADEINDPSSYLPSFFSKSPPQGSPAVVNNLFRLLRH